MADEQVNDPLNFMRNVWGNMGFSLPGMVAPTFDLDELDKRIKDMKAVEGWLRMKFRGSCICWSDMLLSSVLMDVS